MFTKRIYNKYKKSGIIGLMHAILTRFKFSKKQKICWDYFWHYRLNSKLSDEMELWKNYQILERQYGDKIRNDYKPTGIKSKVVWWCWLQGEELAPPLCKACLNSIRKNLPEYEIRIITSENMFKFVSFPQHIIDKFQKGIISFTHFSDILRTQLLIEHGGVWIDSTVFCTGYHTTFLSEPFFAFQNWKFNMEEASVISSWFLSAEKGYPILKATQDLIFDYWKDHNKIINYYLFHLFFHLATTKYIDLWESVPRYSNIPPHILQFELFEPYSEKRFNNICKMSDFHKLSRKDKRFDQNFSGTFADVVINKQ